jgi:hypothetical protein
VFKGLGSIAIVACLLSSFTTPVHAATIVLTAFDSDSINKDGLDVWNDNWLRAYVSPPVYDIDGYLKFDLSAIPEPASITGMTLTVHGFISSSSPTVSVFRSDSDGWKNNVDDSYPGRVQQLTSGLVVPSLFVPEQPTALNWSLDVGAIDWSADLGDNTLSLLLHNSNTFYSFFYAYGASETDHGGVYRPTLEVQYEIAAVSEPEVGLRFFSLVCAFLFIFAARARQH